MNIETEKKYVIEMPDVLFLSTLENYTESEIEQIYLNTEGVTHRIRRRKMGERVVYTETEKRRISPMSVIETEKEIDEVKYNELKKNRKENSKILVKTRYTFDFLGHTIEIDVYPKWQKSAIMELELKSEGESFSLPPFIKLIKDVTGLFEYSNAKMSVSFPPELI